MTDTMVPDVARSGDRPSWTFRVNDAHLKSSQRISFPEGVAIALGCKPNALTRVSVERPAGCRKLMICWEVDRARLIVRNLAEPLKRIGVGHDQLVDLIVTGPNRVALTPSDGEAPATASEPRVREDKRRESPPAREPSPLAGWGQPPTPLLPRWYIETHGDELLPANFGLPYPAVKRLRDLSRFWESYDAPLDREAVWALRDLAVRLLPPGEFRVIDPGFELEDFSHLPLAVRTRNCLRRGRESIRTGALGELMRLPNFGITSLLDLMCVLEATETLQIDPGKRSDREVSTASVSPAAGRRTRTQNMTESGLSREDAAATADAPLTVPATRHGDDPAAAVTNGLPSDAFPLIASAAQLFHGARTFGDLLRLDLSELITAAGLDESLDELPLSVDSPPLGGQAVANVKARIDAMSDVQRRVTFERVVATSPKRLEELARALGLSRERVRQVAREVGSQLQGATGSIIGLLAVAIQRRLGPVATESEVETHVREMVPAVCGSPTAVTAVRYLLRDRLDYTYRDGIGLNREAVKAMESLANRVDDIADDAGILEDERVLDALGPELSAHSDVVIHWIGWFRVSGQIVRRASARARVKAALIHIGAPATKAQLASESGLSESQVGGALSNLDSVARADKSRWGLREWIDDVYEGVPAEIIQRINEDGGSTRLNRVLEELPRLFGVSEASVWAYLNTPAFRVEHGWVSETDESDIHLGRLEDVIDGRNEQGEPYWTFEVANRHLRGYSLHGVPPEIAFALGCPFGGRSTASVRKPDNCQDISIIWRKTSMHGPEIGRLSDALKALNPANGIAIGLTLHNDREVSLRPTESRRASSASEADTAAISTPITGSPILQGVRPGPTISARLTVTSPSVPHEAQPSTPDDA